MAVSNVTDFKAIQSAAISESVSCDKIRLRRHAPTTDQTNTSKIQVAEFFAGIGLVRIGLEGAGFNVVWANDIAPLKHAIYASNFDVTTIENNSAPGRDAKGDIFVLRDVAAVDASEVPDVGLATASFPCTDLSLAGDRAGLAGNSSSTVWGFIRIIKDMTDRKPPVVMLENVPGLATSHGGKDLHALISALNEIGYSCDVFTVDAVHFVPQSRTRLFIVGCMSSHGDYSPAFGDDWMRPPGVRRFLDTYAGDLSLHRVELPLPPERASVLADAIDGLPEYGSDWWNEERTEKFVASLAPLQAERLQTLRRLPQVTWRTAYRRTRNGKATWEIRRDEIAGCLRTARGGSSKQALVKAGNGNFRLRWMTPREYARLMGADDINLDAVTPNQALFGIGDAVCVPVIRWLAENYLKPLLDTSRADTEMLAS